MRKFWKRKRINKSLTNGVFGKNIIYMPVCTSTNDIAKQNTDMAHGTVFIADAQTAGRGRHGRDWESEKKTGIYMSVLLKPNIPPDKVSQITLITAVALCRALGCNTQIKWPNDIIIGTKKISGILTERVNDAVICGIGINVNTKAFPDDLLLKATSLFLETGEKYDTDYICAVVLNELESVYNVFMENGFMELCEEYKSLCITLNNDVVVSYGTHELGGYAYDITDTGELILETDEGDIAVNSGEVSVRGIYGYV